MKAGNWINAIEKEDMDFFQRSLPLKRFLLEKCPLGFSAKELVLLLDKRSLFPFFGIGLPPNFLLLEAQDDELKRVSLEQFEQFFSFSYSQVIKFSSYKQLKKTVSLAPWSYAKSLFFSEERELGKALQEEIFFKKTSSFSVRFIDQLLGFGLYAEKAFEKNAFLGTYSGAFSANSEVQTSTYCFKYPVCWTSVYAYCVNAEKTGNLTRFINHSDRPNVLARPLILNKIVFIALFALHPIEKGEELFLNYGSDYFKKRVLNNQHEENPW